MMLTRLLLLLLLFSAPARAEIVVGVAAPLSGAFARIGAEIRAGVEQGAQAINAQGGLLGEKIRVEAVDDRCEAASGEAVANQLVGKEARLVIGHACTAAALPAARVYAAHTILFISPAATNPRLTDEAIGPGIFRLAPRSDRQGATLAAHLAKHFSGKRVGFIHDGSVYGQGLVEAVARGLEEKGGKSALMAPFTPGEQSQNALVGQLQDAGLDAVVIGALHSDAAIIAREMRRRGLTAALLGGEALGLEAFTLLAGAASEGVIVALPETPRAQPGRMETAPASALFLASRAALEIYAEAVTQAGSTETGLVRAALRRSRFSTALGPVSFDEKGDWREARWPLHRWQDGTLVPLTEE